MIDRYGDAIERDFHAVYSGLDIVDFFRVVDGQRRYSWRKMQNLIRQLRLSDRSAMVEAQSQDPDHAAWVLSQPEQPSSGPAVADFTPDHAMLVDIRDALADLRAVVVASIPGNKYKAPAPSRRPSTALSRARAQASQARHTSLVDEVKAAQERWLAAHPPTT